MGVEGPSVTTTAGAVPDIAWSQELQVGLPGHCGRNWNIGGVTHCLLGA